MLGVALTLRLTAFAQGGSEISGTVKDATGAVVPGASVTLRDAKGAPIQKVATDASGRYSLAGIAPGGYTLLVFLDGFAPVTEEIRVDSGPVTRDLVMRIAGFAEEVTVSFTGEQARTALKMEAAVRDVPLSIKSYTTSFVKALDAKTVGDLYTYMNGINRTGLGVEDAAIRGFSAGPDAFDVQLNGIPGFTTRFYSPNIANLERVEVLKGPASVLYGRVSPGGLINIITKRPLDQPQRLVDLRFGSFAGTGPGLGDANSYRLATDLTGPIGNGRRVLYRLIASYDNADSFRDFVKSEDILVTPSVTWNISAATTLTIEGEYRHVNSSFDSGLVAPQNDIHLVAPITTRYQEPDDSETDGGWASAAYLTKAFGGGWGLNVNWRTAFQADERSGYETNSVLTDNHTVRRRDRRQVSDRQSHFLDATVSKTARTAGISHGLLLGLGGGHQFDDIDRPRFRNLDFDIDLYHPVYGLYALPGNPNPDTHRALSRWNYNGYLQDRIDFSRQWKGLLSLRYDWLDWDYKPLRLPDAPAGSRTYTALLPTGGLVFQPDTRWSVYGSFATSFEPKADLANADPIGPLDFKPEHGRQFETGVKAELAGGRAAATLALYHITKVNVIVPLDATTNTQVGQQRSQGVEVDLRLRPAEHFQAILGYTYTDAKVTQDTRPQFVGSRLINSPKQAFNGWGRYDIVSGAANGLGFGLGLIYRGDRAGSLSVQQALTANRPTFVLLPAYFRMDAALYLVRGRSETTFRVNNVLDEIYYESSRLLTQIRPGRPREVTLSFRVRL